MSDDPRTELPKADENDAKLQQLIDMTIENNIRERNEILEYWSALKKDPTKRVVVDRLKLNTSSGSRIDFSIECNSSLDLEIWKLCITAAIAKFKIPDIYFTANIKNIEVFMKDDDLEKLLNYLGPLLKRTHFVTITWYGSEKLKSRFSELLEPVAESHSNNKLFGKLENTALKHQLKTWNKTLEYWKVLKHNTDRRIVAFEFWIRPVDEDEGYDTSMSLSHISAYFRSQLDMEIWKSCIIAAISTLKDPKFSPILEINISSSYDVSLTLETENLKSIFEYLKPLAPKMQTSELNLYRADLQAVISSSKFFDASTGIAFFDSCNRSKTKFDVWLDCVRKVRPSVAVYDDVETIQDVSEFLVPLSELVETIIIENWYLEPFSLYVREILRKKCKYLEVQNGTVLTLADAEKLVQFFNHSGMKVSLMVNTDIKDMDVQIGEYKLDTDQWMENGILIEHIDATPKFDDIR